MLRIIKPWADEAVAAEQVKGRYIISLKPGPSVRAFPSFDEKEVKKELRVKLTHVKDCYVEMILKDICTVKFEPQRLWKWTEAATRGIKEFE